MQKRTGNWELKHLKKLKSLPYEEAHPQIPTPTPKSQYWMTIYVHEDFKVGVYGSAGVGGFLNKEKWFWVLPGWKWGLLLAVTCSSTQTNESCSNRSNTKHSTQEVYFYHQTLSTLNCPALCKVTQRQLDFEITLYRKILQSPLQNLETEEQMAVLSRLKIPVKMMTMISVY